MASTDGTTVRAEAIAVVTGASTGIGAATARELAKSGFHVLAGVRQMKHAESLRGSNLEPIMLDITDTDAVAALAKRVDEERRQGRPLRALVNNAGIQINSPVETLPLSDWRRLFEVNVLGHVAVTQALLPALLEKKGSTIVNVTSVGGKVAMAGYGPYASTKWALEAISDSLRREVEQLGVRVVVIEPGAVATEMLSKVVDTKSEDDNGMNLEQRHRYGALMHAVTEQARAGLSRAVPAQKVGQVITHAIASKRPHTRYTVGFDAAIVVRLVNLLSDRFLDMLLRLGLRKYLPTSKRA